MITTPTIDRELKYLVILHTTTSLHESPYSKVHSTIKSALALPLEASLKQLSRIRTGYKTAQTKALTPINRMRYGQILASLAHIRREVLKLVVAAKVTK